MNVFSPSNPGWDERRKVLRAGFRDIAPDIVAVQEAGWYDDIDPVTDLLGEGYNAVAHSGRSEDGVGAFLASRYPLDLIAEVDLHVTDRVTLPWAAATIVEVDAPKEVGDLIVVHHKPTWQMGYSLERELQAVACARAIEDLLQDRPAHVVILGDFDDPPDSASLRFWAGLESLGGMSVSYRDAWTEANGANEGLTFTPSNPLVRGGEFPHEEGRRIDYILIRCNAYGPTLAVEECHRVFDVPAGGIWASDHFGVMADLEPFRGNR